MKKKSRVIFGYFIAKLLLILFSKRIKKRALNGEFILSIFFHEPSRKLFESCVSWLLKNGFVVLSQSDLYQIYNNTIQFPKGGVVITADDGWISNEENIVAIADKYKIPITIFVSSGPVEEGNYWWCYVEKANRDLSESHSVESMKRMPNEMREEVYTRLRSKVCLQRNAMTIQQVKRVSRSKYVAIGGHTTSHPILPMCSDEKAYDEIHSSKATIESWIGDRVISFAYPNGDYGEREIEYLKDCGYKMAFTTEPAYIERNTKRSLYEIPRFSMIEDISKAEAICRMLGLWQKYI